MDTVDYSHKFACEADITYTVDPLTLTTEQFDVHKIGQMKFITNTLAILLAAPNRS